MKFTNPKIDRNAPCWCGSGKKYKHCHEAFDEKIRSFEMKGAVVPSRKLIKTPLDIEGIKASAKINIKVLDAVSDQIKVGMSTEEIDQIVYDVTKAAGAIPAPLHYEGFPKSVCTSINEEVCHGIPSPDRILKDGDIINVDVSTIYKGYFSDSSRMFCIGNVSPENKKLVDVTKECVEIGIKHVIPWTFLGDMGHAVHQHGEGIFFQLGHRPESPFQGFGFFCRGSRCDALAVGYAMHPGQAAMFAGMDTNKDGFIDAAEHKASTGAKGAEGKCGEGKCGEGKCGGDKKTGDK